ncbi:hypothetical protein ACW95P_04700, partial [Candidatus Mycoplasma pogonae]
MIKKYKNLKKTSLFVLATTPLIVSAISVSAYDEKRRDETKRQWIDRNFSSLTEGQKEYFDWVPEHIRPSIFPSLSAWINQINLDMKDLRINYADFESKVNNSDNEYYNNFFNADEHLKNKFKDQAVKINDMLANRSNPNFNITDMAKLQEIKGEFFQSWNNLNGFKKQLDSLIDAKSNISSAQKTALKTKMASQLGKLQGDDADQQNNINESFLVKVNEFKKQNNDLDNAMIELKNTFTEYNNKKTSMKYINSSESIKNSFNAALAAAQTNDSYSEMDPIKIQKLKTSIVEAYNKLDGSDKKDILKAKLSTDPFNEWNAATLKAINDEIDKASTDSQFDSIEAKLNTTGTEYTNAKTSLQELKKYKTESTSEVDYRLADNAKKTEFDTKLNNLKNRLENAKNSAGTNFWNDTSKSDFGTTATAANNAKNTLNGKENKTAAENTINNLSNISDTTKIEAKTKISNKTQTPNKTVLDKIKTDLQEANNKFNDLKAKLKEYTDTIGYVKHDKATNFSAQDQAVVDSLNLVLDSPKLTSISNTTIIDSKKLIATTGAEVQAAIDSINTAIGKLNGEENLKNQKQGLINTAKTEINNYSNLSNDEKKTLTDKLDVLDINDASESLTNFETKVNTIKAEATTLNNLNKTKVDLKAKLKTDPFNKLNATTIADFGVKIDAASDIAALNRIETKAKSLANKVDEWKVKITELEAEKTKENYSLATEILKDAFDAALSTLKNKVENENIADETVASIDALASNAETAKNNLDGAKILADKIAAKKKVLNYLLTNSEFNSVAPVIINTIKAKIAAVGDKTQTDLDKLDELEPKIISAKEVVKKINEKINELENKKTDTPLNFNLADDDKKAKYDKVINDLKDHLKEDLFDLAKVNAAEATLTEADSLVLNGHDNLGAVRDAIDKLDNLSSDQKEQAKVKLTTASKVKSKTDLTNNEALFKEIDNKLGAGKTKIDGITDLKTAEKTALIAKLGAINISDLTAEQAQAEINKVTLEAEKNVLVNNAIKEIDALNNLSPALIMKISDTLKAFDKTNATEDKTAFETKINNIKNKAVALNTKYKTEVEAKFNDYVSTIGTTKYDEANNKDTQNDAVYAALNEIVIPTVTKPSVLTNTEKINTLKIGNDSDSSLDTESLLDSLTTKVEEVGIKILQAKDGLNGETVLAKKISDKKAILISKVDSTAEFNELPKDDVTNFKNKINSSTSLTELEKLDKTIGDTASTIGKIKQRIEKLKEKQTKANYRLSDSAKQKEFDEIITKLENHLKENLFDDTKRASANKDLDDFNLAIAVTKLNGDDSLKNAIKEVKELKHLNNDQKTQAETKLVDLTKTTSKADLESAKTLFTNINNKIETAKATIDALPHLVKETKAKAIKDLGKINIAAIDESAAETAINNVIADVATLNTSLNDELIKLKSALKKYTNEITNPKHDVTQNIANIDQEVITELKKVLDDVAAITLTNSFNIDTKKLSTNNVDDIKAAISNIDKAYVKLNGDSEIANLIKQLDSDPLNSLNTATKEAIKSAANRANSYTKLQEVVAKADQAMTNAQTIKTKIAAMKLVKNNANYKVANDNLKATFDNEITNLETKLNSENLFNKSSADITSIFKLVDDANVALNGNTNLAIAERDIKALSNLATNKKNAIIFELKNLTKIDNKTKLDNLVTKFTNINSYIETKKAAIKNLNHFSSELQNEFITSLSNITDLTKNESGIKNEIDSKFNEAQAINIKFDNLKSEVAKYKAALRQPKYTEATLENKRDQNQKVQEALESVLKDKTYANIETDLLELTTETYKAGTTLTAIEASITKIEDALNSLNGLTQVNDDKTKVKDKVNNAGGIYTPLNDNTKKAILDDLDKVDTNTKAEVNAIDTKAGKTLDLHNRLTAKITELKNFKTDPNYKLASGVEKNNYDLALEKLNEQLIKNLYDDTNSSESEGAITSADAAKAALDGNNNLANTKTIIDGLTNLLDSTRTDITTNLDNINKYGYKAALDAVTTKFSAINTKLGQVNTNINALNHLSQAAKDSFINEAKTIDINVDQTAIETKI